MVDLDAAIIQKQITAFGTRFAPEFNKRVLDLLSTNPSEQEWFALLNDLLGEPLQRDLARYTDDLRAAGFRISDEDATQLAEKVIQDVLSQTSDVWNNYRSAKNPTTVTAAGWSLGALVRNSDAFLRSIVSTAREHFGDAAFTKQNFIEILAPMPGLTGRRLFLAGDKEGGRHSAIHGQIAEKGRGWYLPDRPEHGLSADNIFFPKEQMNTPKGRNEWSGSKSRVLYGYWDPTLQQEIFLGPRGGRYDSNGERLRTQRPTPQPQR